MPPTMREDIDEALRAETSMPRSQLVLSVNQRGLQHIRSYVIGARYRGAALTVRPDQLQDWVIHAMANETLVEP